MSKVEEIIKLHIEESWSVWCSFDYVLLKGWARKIGLDVENFHFPLNLVDRYPLNSIGV